MDIDTIITQEYAKGTPVKDIALLVSRHRSKVITRAKRLGLVHPGRCVLNGIIDKETNSSSLKGETAMVKEPTPAELASFEEHCKANGLPYANWRGFWHKTREYSSFFVNVQAQKDDEARYEQFLEDMKRYAPKYRTMKYKKLTDKHLQLIDPADVHVGKLAFARDGRIGYDIERAVYLAETGVTTLLNRSQGFPTEKFILPIGNDVLHVDSTANTTTKGTRQDVSGHWSQMVDAAATMYIRMLEEMVQVAPVHVVYNNSNHDSHSGYQLAREIRAWMSKNKHITFTISQNDREYVKYGVNMIGLDHGDGAKTADVPLLMASEAPQLWGDTTRRYMIRHHLHHWQKREFLAGKDFPGITVQHMRSVSLSDPWHAKSGYTGAPQAIDSFIFHPVYGQTDHMSCVFE